MPSEYRLTIRLSAELYDQLATRGSHGQPLAAILREALIDYLPRQPGQPPAAAMADDLAAIRARLESIEQRLEAMEATAASRQPQTPARQPPRPRPAASAARANTTPTAATTDTAALGYDPAKYSLGLLCPRNHEYHGTGKTLRRLPRHVCPACDVEQQRDRRAAKREGRG